MECQIAAKLLSHLTIGVSNNTILHYKKAIPRPLQHTFCSTRLFTFQASFVVIWRTLCNLQWIAWQNDAMHVSVSFVWNACASHVMHESWEPRKDPMARLFQQRKYQLLWNLLCGKFVILHSKVPTVFYQVWGVAFFPGLHHLQYLHECYQYANMKGGGLRDHIMCNDVM